MIRGRPTYDGGEMLPNELKYHDPTVESHSHAHKNCQKKGSALSSMMIMLNLFFFVRPRTSPDSWEVSGLWDED